MTPARHDEVVPATPPGIVVLETEGTVVLTVKVSAHKTINTVVYVLVEWLDDEKNVYYQAFEWVTGTHYVRAIKNDDIYTAIHQELCDLLPE